MGGGIGRSRAGSGGGMEGRGARGMDWGRSGAEGRCRERGSVRGRERGSVRGSGDCRLGSLFVLVIDAL